MTFLEERPGYLCGAMRMAGIQRLAFIRDAVSEQIVATHVLGRELAAWMNEASPDFDGHEAVFLQISPRTGVLQSAFVHRTCRGQAAGGVRFRDYPSLADFFHDGLRLSRGMTLKNALAGLWWGGGKGVMALDSAWVDVRGHREAIYEDYGAFLTTLRGAYVTAEDVGTLPEDMAAVFKTTRFVTCIPPHLGGSGNPSEPTASGVVVGMEAALHHLALGGLEGKTVAVQGLGQVASFLIEKLLSRGVKAVLAADVEAARCRAAKGSFPERVEIRQVDPEDTTILAEPVDILAPCAVGAVLNARTIPTVRAMIVCGAANNQLEDPPRDDAALAQRGVLYVPDFLVNRMGIVNCADEQAGYVVPDPVVAAHLSREWEEGIFQHALQVFAEAQRSERAPGAVALEMAQARSRVLHPLWGHRALAIARGVVATGWAEGRL